MPEQTGTTGETVALGPAAGSHVELRENWLPSHDCEQVLTALHAREARFEGGHHLVEGRKVPTPRMVLSFSDAEYAFEDIGASLPWPDCLSSTRERIEASAGHPFNYALANWYRDGSDFTGWHSDKIEHHVAGSQIAILSLGAMREIAFRPIGSLTPSSTVPLRSGSLLWMSCALQKVFEHAVPKDPAVRAERFSVTFRYLKTAKDS